MFLNGTKKAKK